MKTLAKVMMISLVLGVMVLAPSMANATPARAAMVGMERSPNMGILDLFFKMLGFKAETRATSHDTHSTTGAATPAAPQGIGTSGPGSVSTEGAIWGCRLYGIC
jgi:hypothetical protein